MLLTGYNFIEMDYFLLRTTAHKKHLQAAKKRRTSAYSISANAPTGSQLSLPMKSHVVDTRLIYRTVHVLKKGKEAAFTTSTAWSSKLQFVRGKRTHSHTLCVCERERDA